MGLLGFLRKVWRGKKWLQRAGDLLDKHGDQLEALSTVLITSDKLRVRVSKAFSVMREAEETVGAHTEFWDKVEKGEPFQVDPDEIAYLQKWKGGFDHLKGLAGLDDADGDVDPD